MATQPALFMAAIRFATNTTLSAVSLELKIRKALRFPDFLCAGHTRALEGAYNRSPDEDDGFAMRTVGYACRVHRKLNY